MPIHIDMPTDTEMPADTDKTTNTDRTQAGNAANQRLCRAHPASTLTGRVRIPGDKSISHRALMFAAVAQGTSRIHGLLEGDDVLRTAAAMRALGADIERYENSPVSSPATPSIVRWDVTGRPPHSPVPRDGDQLRLYFGNAGTGARLTMGLAAGIIAGHAQTVTFDGDASPAQAAHAPDP